MISRNYKVFLRKENINQSDVLLWNPTYGRSKAGRPARTCIQQLCEDTGCSPEDLPEAINDRVWFVRFYGISIFIGYLTPNPFLCK